MRWTGLTTILLCACNPCPEPFYGGNGSDEAWRAMVDAEKRATVDDSKAATFTVPSEGQIFSAGATAPPTLQFTSTLMAANEWKPTPPPSLLGRLSELLISSAWAHLPPITGPVHWLRITVPGQSCRVELITTRTEWTPEAEAWSKLTAAQGKTLSLDAVSAFLTDNRVTEGPYKASAARTFSVGP